jgi:hypothetical protein
MTLLVAVLYVLAVLLLVLSAFGVAARVSLATLGAASALLAYALPAINVH